MARRRTKSIPPVGPPSTVDTRMQDAQALVELARFFIPQMSHIGRVSLSSS